MKTAHLKKNEDGTYAAIVKDAGKFVAEVPVPEVDGGIEYSQTFETVPEDRIYRVVDCE